MPRHRLHVDFVGTDFTPYRLLGKRQRHLDLLRSQAQRHRVYVLAVNQFGANDELIFDGLRCGFGPQGELLACSRPFDGESLVCIDVPCRAHDALDRRTCIDARPLDEGSLGEHRREATADDQLHERSDGFGG